MLELAIEQFGIVFMIYASMASGMILFKLRVFLENKTPEWMHSPLFDCPVCMSPWYGTLIGFLFLDASLLESFIASLICGGLCYVVIRITNAIDERE